MQYDMQKFNVHSEADVSQLNVTNDVRMKSQIIKTKQITVEQNNNISRSIISRGLTKISLHDLDLWPHDLENVITSFPSVGSICLSFGPDHSTVHQLWTGVQKILIVVVAWPLTPWPWKFNQFFHRLVPMCVKFGEDHSWIVTCRVQTDKRKWPTC